MAEPAIINASPLIFLSRSGYLELLQAFSPEVWVPDAVAGEILRRGREDISARAISETSWLSVRPAIEIPPQVVTWNLGPGESAVIALAREYHLEAIIDDLAGRRCASSLGIPLRGTLGLVLAAKQRGLIAQARPVIENMMKNGLYLSKKVVESALSRVGE